MKKKPNPFLLLFFFSYGYIIALLISPALPSIQTYFQTTSGISQLPFSVYIAGFAIAQLIYGPLANRFGRKKSMFFAVFLSLLCSCFCLVAIWFHSIFLFVFFRFFQAIGACGCLALTFIIVSDVFEGVAKRQFIVFFPMTYAISCFFAVLIGGWLIHYFSLSAIFYFCLLLGILEFFCVLSFPETGRNQDSNNKLKLKTMLQRYGYLFTKKRFVYLSTITGGIAGVSYFFNQSAPYIGIDYLKMSAANFGNQNSIVYLGILLGALLARFLVKRWTPKIILLMNLSIGTIVGLVWLGLFILGFVNSYTLFIPGGALFLFLAVLYPVGTSWALESGGDNEYGPALLSFLYVGISFIALLIANFIHTTNPVQLPLIMCAILFIVWILLILVLTAKEETSKGN